MLGDYRKQREITLCCRPISIFLLRPQRLCVRACVCEQELAEMMQRASRRHTNNENDVN